MLFTVCGPWSGTKNIIWYILPESTLHELKFCLEIAFMVLYCK